MLKPEVKLCSIEGCRLDADPAAGAQMLGHLGRKGILSTLHFIMLDLLLTANPKVEMVTRPATSLGSFVERRVHGSV